VREELEELTGEDLSKLSDEEVEALYIYITNEVNSYKKETTEYLDEVKILLFSCLLLGTAFIDKFDKLSKEYQIKMINKQAEGIEHIKEVINAPNTSDISETYKNTLQELKLDTTSQSAANKKFGVRVKQYYKNALKSVGIDNINIKEYLIKKLDKYEAIEKVVRYKNGSYYGIDAYNSMVYNTNLTRTAWSETIKRNAVEGNDLVYVIPHMYSCPLCQEWQGMTYSISGHTQGYMKLETAIENGLLHPNCKHVIVAYAGQEDDFTYSTPEWEEKYDIKQKINALNLKKSRLRNENIISAKLDDYENIDKNKKKISAINKEIRALKQGV
jgi:hypothetical protein